MSDETLMGFVTEAYPIIAFCKQLENKERRLMEIMECEILADGTRRYRPLFQYQITENRVEDGKFVIVGHHRQINPISDSLARRLLFSPADRSSERVDPQPYLRTAVSESENEGIPERRYIRHTK